MINIPTFKFDNKPIHNNIKTENIKLVRLNTNLLCCKFVKRIKYMRI